MVFDLGQFLFDKIMDLVWNAVSSSVQFGAMRFLERQNIELRIKAATTRVIEPLEPFLRTEIRDTEQQRLLVETCINELRPLALEHERLISGSLSGEKIFTELYREGHLPEVVVDAGIEGPYSLFFIRVAETLCRIPETVKAWEADLWAENFDRLDKVAERLAGLFISVDKIANAAQNQADELLVNVRRSVGLSIGLKMDLSGCRGEVAYIGKFDDFFVFPELHLFRLNGEKGEMVQSQVVGDPASCFSMLVGSHQNVIVTGAAGAGKSTWSRWLQRETVSERWNGLGVRVELRRFSNTALMGLHELISEAAGVHYSAEVDPQRIRKWLDRRLVCFILDGFDEVAHDQRDDLVDWIKGLKLAAPGCPVIITSRPITTDHLERLAILSEGSENWHEIRIQPFDRPRITEYITLWHKHTPLTLEGMREVDVVRLAESWQLDPVIAPLTGNPLLLSTLLMVHHLDGELPEGRAELYKRYVNGMLGQWDSRRNIPAGLTSLTQWQKRELLQALALHLLLHEKEQLEEIEITTWINGYLKKNRINEGVNEILRYLRERTGLIVGPGVYSFAHKSIGEYLAAEAVVEGDQVDLKGHQVDCRYLFQRRNKDRWNMITFFWAGLAPKNQVQMFIEACFQAGDWSLGCGVLLDRYDSLGLEARKRLVNKIFDELDDLESKLNKQWWIFTPARPASYLNDISKPVYQIKTIQSNERLADDQPLHELFEKAKKDKLIGWDDLKRLNSEIREQLWLFFITRPDTREEMRQSLIAPWPVLESLIFEWRLGVFRTVIDRSLRKKLSLSPKEITEIAQAAFPDMGGAFFLELLSELIPCNFQQQKWINQSTNAAALFNSLASITTVSMDAGWLQGTREWIPHPQLPHGEQTCIDLLTAFLEAAQANVWGLNRTDWPNVEHVTSVVKRLIDQREHA